MVALLTAGLIGLAVGIGGALGGYGLAVQTGAGKTADIQVSYETPAEPGVMAGFESIMWIVIGVAVLIIVGYIVIKVVIPAITKKGKKK